MYCIGRKRAEVPKDAIDGQTGRVGETFADLFSALLVVDLVGLVFNGLVASFA